MFLSDSWAVDHSLFDLLTYGWSLFGVKPKDNNILVFGRWFKRLNDYQGNTNPTRPFLLLV
jgi:hypothetical protein